MQIKENNWNRYRNSSGRLSWTPIFAVAYAGLAGVYANKGESDRAMEYQQKAYDLRDRVSERERFNLMATYHWVVTGDLDKETETEEQWARAYPREGEPLNNLTVDYARSYGDYEKAIAVGNEALGRGGAIKRDCTPPWASLISL